MEKIIGTWLLKGSVSITSEITFVGEDPDPNGVKQWLNGSGSELIKDIAATKGLRLIVAEDGSFEEYKEGSPEVYWFSSEGVLESEVTPFDGNVISNAHGYFLIPDETPSWAIPKIDYGAILRYDDGDTKISDRIFEHEGHLVRIVNVVTDEMYFDRIVSAYIKE